MAGNGKQYTGRCGAADFLALSLFLRHHPVVRNMIRAAGIVHTAVTHPGEDMVQHPPHPENAIEHE